MNYLAIHFRVEDFSRWRSMFDQGHALRKNSGSKGARILRSADDPNGLMVIMEWDSLDRARQFAQSAELREAMQKAGVIGRPEVSFLNLVEDLDA